MPAKSAIAGPGSPPGGRRAKISEELQAQRKLYKVHLKNVPVLSERAISELPVRPGDEHLIDTWKQALRYIKDPSVYTEHFAADAPSGAELIRTAKVPRVPPATHSLMLERGAAEVVPVANIDLVAGVVNFFFHPEDAKQRNRVIKDAVTVNATLPRDQLQKQVRPATKQELIDFVIDHNYAWESDMAGYYDQFPLDPAVRYLFVYPTRPLPADPANWRDGDLLCPTRLLMGVRPACETAQATTDVLRSFPQETDSCSIIDNVEFGGETVEAVQHAKVTFLDRCAKGNVTLNEYGDIVQVLDFGGIHQDLANKEVSLTQKVVNKIRGSWELRDTWSFRHFAGHVGLLFWAWDILGVEIGDFFSLLRFISRVRARMQEAGDRQWDEPISLAPYALPQLEEWTNICLENKPRKVVRGPSRPQWLIITDASAWGWGYVAVNMETGEVRVHGEPWSAADLRRNRDPTGKSLFRRSTFAESEGILRSICHILVRPAPDAPCVSVLVGTDSTTAKSGHSRGFSSKSYHVNNIACRLRKLFPRKFFNFSFVHVAGEVNDLIADPFSRKGGDVRAAEVDGKRLHALGAEVRRVMGGATPTVFDTGCVTVPSNGVLF